MWINWEEEEDEEELNICRSNSIYKMLHKFMLQWPEPKACEVSLQPLISINQWQKYWSLIDYYRSYEAEMGQEI